MKSLITFTVIATGLLTLLFYSAINYILFKDVGFVSAGRIVFTTNFGYYDYLILPIGIVAGTMFYRKNSNSEFKNLLEFGLKTTFFAAVFFSTFIFVYLECINPGFFYKLTDLIRQLEVSGRELTPLTREMIIRAKSIENTELYRNAYFYFLANLIVYLIAGTLTSFACAAILKKQKKKN